MAIFLNIKRADDHVLPNLLLAKLFAMEVPPYLVRAISQFVSGRQVFVKSPSGPPWGPFQVSRGLPQGSPLSPVLFNCYTSSIHEQLPTGANIIQFSDDIVLYVAGGNMGQLFSVLDRALAGMHAALSTLGLSLSPKKCSAILFRRGRSSRPLDDIVVEGSLIPWKPVVPYLGVYLHQNMKRTSDIDQCFEKV